MGQVLCWGPETDDKSRQLSVQGWMTGRHINKTLGQNKRRASSMKWLSLPAGPVWESISRRHYGLWSRVEGAW